MTTTTEKAQPAGARSSPDAGSDMAPPPPGRDPRTRARAYLDLWERHLTHVAIEGPPVAPAPVPPSPLETARDTATLPPDRRDR